MVYVKSAVDGQLHAGMKRNNGRKFNKGDNQFRHIDLYDRRKWRRRRKLIYLEMETKMAFEV